MPPPTRGHPRPMRVRIGRATVMRVAGTHEFKNSRARPLVVAIGNPKGGSGKTTSVLALAEAAVANGLRVAIVDLDPQCNITEVLEPADTNAAGTRDLLRASSHLTLASCLTSTGWQGVWLCQAEFSLTNREYTDHEPGAETRLAEAIELDAGGVDLVLLDLPGSRGWLALTALVAADKLLVPTEATVFSANSAVHLIDEFLPAARRHNPHLEVAGIVITKWSGTAEQKRVASELSTSYPELVRQPYIPRRDAVATIHQAWHQPLRQAGGGDRKAAAAIADAYAAHGQYLFTPLIQGASADDQ